MDAEEAIMSRRSVRAFLPTPVPRQTVERILEVASRAPSGTNMQPWRAYVVAGEARRRVSEAVLKAREAEGEVHVAEHRYYPREWREPYIGRRRKVGLDLYDLVGVKKGDKAAMFRQHGRNFEFFGAPVGLFFTIDRHLEIGSWLDFGMFIEAVMVAARAHELHTCPQAAWPPYHRVIRRILPIPEHEAIVCGMALGHEDPKAPENRLRTERAPLGDWATFIDLDA